MSDHRDRTGQPTCQVTGCQRGATWRYVRSDNPRPAFVCNTCRRDFGRSMRVLGDVFGFRIRWASLPLCPAQPTLAGLLR